MGNKKTVSEKTQYLADTYLRINEEGRNLLDMVIQELQKTHGESEEIIKIKELASVKSFGGKSEK